MAAGRNASACAGVHGHLAGKGDNLSDGSAEVVTGGVVRRELPLRPAPSAQLARNSSALLSLQTHGNRLSQRCVHW